jgi:Mrp family chromosome partitioning ATPase
VVGIARGVKGIRAQQNLSGMADHDAAARPDFHAAAGLLRRRYLVMLPFLLIPIAALVFSLKQEERYTASASVLFSDEDKIASGLPEREAATNVQLLSVNEIRRGVEERLGDQASIAEEVEVGQEGAANVLTITATDPSPERAARTANAYAAAYIDFRRRTARRELLAEQRFLREEIERLGSSKRARARKRNLEQQLRRLEFDRTRERGGARIVEDATPPSSPSSPKPVRNTIIGGIVAVVLALLTALLFERLDPRVVTPREIESTLGRPILGLIRKSRGLARSPVAGRPQPEDLDDFLALRAHLRYLESDRNIRSVLVTSSSEGDGKTTVAWNLARVAAGRDTRVLFVEGDLRHPVIARTLGLDPAHNLGQILDGSAALPDVTQEVALPNAENGRLPPGVMAIALAGRATSGSTDAVAWERLGAALREAEQQFDLIVIDTAPILLVPDAIPLLSQVGGVVVVGRLRSTPRVALARLREQLDTVGAPTLGAVVNAVGRDTAYGYGYHARRE